MKQVFCLLLLGFLIFFIKFKEPFSPDHLVLNQVGVYSEFAFPDFTSIIKKPLKYLGQGKQSVAFVSDDGEIVVKFFLKKPLRTRVKLGAPAWFKNLFSEKKQKTFKPTVLLRYERAFQLLKQETGLLAVHLNQTDSDWPLCKLIDDKGFVYEVDLNKYSFILQQKGSSCKKKLSELSNDERGKAYNSIEKLLCSIARKGFINGAKNFNQNNYAFIGNNPILIDLGNIEYSPQEDRSLEVKKLINYIDQVR